MEEFRNFHRLSQQGFESMNALITSVFFWRTQRGGFTSQTNPKSKLLPIARWLQRRVLWIYHTQDVIFENVPRAEENANTATREIDMIALGYGLEDLDNQFIMKYTITYVILR
jgi:hypothetical protein